jgi:glucose-6-phosphate 1-dehydrogenase
MACWTATCASSASITTPPAAEAFAERLHAFMLERDQGREGSERCLDDKLWARLAKRLDYQTGDFLDDSDLPGAGQTHRQDQPRQCHVLPGHRATLLPEVAQRLGDAGLLDESAGAFGGW